MSGLRLKCCGLKQLNCGLQKRTRLHCCAKNLLRCCGKNLQMNGLRWRQNCCLLPGCCRLRFGKLLRMSGLRWMRSGLSLQMIGWWYLDRFWLRYFFYPDSELLRNGLLQKRMTCSEMLLQMSGWSLKKPGSLQKIGWRCSAMPQNG